MQQREINVILRGSGERWFNISNQASIECRYNICRVDLKSQRCNFNVNSTLSYG